MRTTLTIDDDVAVALERLRKGRDVSLKEIVNDLLRSGLREMGARQKPVKVFRTKPVDLGALRVASIDNVAEALAIAEGEAFR